MRLGVQKRGERLLLRIDFTDPFARFAENARLSGGHGIVQQAGNTRELKDHRVSFFQSGIALCLDADQARIRRRQLQRGIADIQNQPEQGDGGDQRQLRSKREILEHASTPQWVADTT